MSSRNWVSVSLDTGKHIVYFNGLAVTKTFDTRKDAHKHLASLVDGKTQPEYPTVERILSRSTV
jgi:hypothetical protein